MGLASACMGRELVTRRTALRTAAFAAGALGLQRFSPAEPLAPKFSLAHLTVLACPPPQLIEIAGRAGYDYASLRIIPMRLAGEPDYDLARKPAMLRETRHALAATALKLHDIEVGRIADGVDVADYVPSFECGGELGARRVICSVWTADHTFAVDSLARMCEFAKKSGLSISLEFVTWANVRNLRQAMELLRTVNKENLGLLIDVLHFDRSHVDPKELDAVPPSFFHFVHLCDAPKLTVATTKALIHTGREARLYPGEGAIDIRGIVKRLPPIPFSLEVPNLVRVKELGYQEHARRCLEAAKRCLKVG